MAMLFNNFVIYLKWNLDPMELETGITFHWLKEPLSNNLVVFNKKQYLAGPALLIYYIFVVLHPKSNLKITNSNDIYVVANKLNRDMIQYAV